MAIHPTAAAVDADERMTQCRASGLRSQVPVISRPVLGFPVKTEHLRRIRRLQMRRQLRCGRERTTRLRYRLSLEKGVEAILFQRMVTKQESQVEAQL